MKRLAWILASLAIAPSAFGQDPVKRAGDQRAMYEDIEVMRAIIARCLPSNCASCHGQSTPAGPFMSGAGMSPMGGGGGVAMGGSSGAGSMNVGSDAGLSFGDPFNERNFDIIVANHPHPGLAMPTIDGVYLKGQGVLFQATMQSVPKSELLATGPLQAPKSLSDWEKARLQIRGEQPKPAASAKQATLVDNLLKALAENGKNFAHLPENESLTLVITFRETGKSSSGRGGMGGSMGGPGMGAGGGMGGPGMLNPMGAAAPTGGGGMPPTGPMGGLAGSGGGGPAPPMGGAGAGDELAGGRQMTPDRELELLGDLHQKRGNWNDAASAYERALKAAASAVRVRELAGKLAELYLKTGNLEKARKVLDQASGEAPKAKQAPFEIDHTLVVKHAIKLPIRLMISAPKKLLDQVGEGKISLADFRKQATLEVLNFEESSAPRK